MFKAGMMKWTGYVACLEEKRNAYRILVRKTEGKRPLGRHRCTWGGNIKMVLGELEWRVWTVFIWLRRQASGKLLLTGFEVLIVVVMKSSVFRDIMPYTLLKGN
jgi:hypothetical protein